MHAITYQSYGSPDVLQYQTIAKPTPEESEVLIKVVAASANPLDWHFIRGEPRFMRLTSGLLKPKSHTPGADVAGWVEAVGPGVTRFKPGDAVYGGCGDGAFAEYVTVKEKYLAPKPENLTFQQAAAVPVAALTALQALRDVGQVQPGQKVLVNGASGGVGTYTVQIAKVMGAEVTGVCSTRNLELVHSLGAKTVIDYTREDFSRSGLRYDVIIDNVGNCSVADYKRALTPTGRCAVIGMTTMARLLQVALLGAWENRFGSRHITTMLARINGEDLQVLNEMLASGEVKSVIDRSYPLEDAAEAIRYLETSRARGKVIVTVDAAG